MFSPTSELMGGGRREGRQESRPSVRFCSRRLYGPRAKWRISNGEFRRFTAAAGGSGPVAEAAAAHGDGEGAELVGDEVALEDGLERTEIPGVGGDPVDVVMGIGAAGIVADDAAGLMSGMIRLGVWEGNSSTPRSSGSTRLRPAERA